jgi:cation transport ATPase
MVPEEAAFGWECFVIVELSRATCSKMIQNPIRATGYDVVAIPVAAGLLVPWGVDLPMAAGAIAMSGSTIIVAANAQLVRRLRLRDAEASAGGAQETIGPEGKESAR